MKTNIINFPLGKSRKSRETALPPAVKAINKNFTIKNKEAYKDRKKRIN